MFKYLLIDGSLVERDVWQTQRHQLIRDLAGLGLKQAAPPFQGDGKKEVCSFLIWPDFFEVVKVNYFWLRHCDSSYDQIHEGWQQFLVRHEYSGSQGPWDPITE